MEKVKSSGWIPNLLTPALLIVIILNTVKITTYVAEIESRTLSSVEMKVRLEDHMATWTPVRQEKAFERLGEAEEAILELKKSDELTLEEMKIIKASLSRIEKMLQ